MPCFTFHFHDSGMVGFGSSWTAVECQTPVRLFAFQSSSRTIGDATAAQADVGRLVDHYDLVAADQPQRHVLLRDVRHDLVQAAANLALAVAVADVDLRRMNARLSSQARARRER